MKPTLKYHGDDLNPNHYTFPRVSNHHTPGWLYLAPETGDAWVFWGIVVMALLVLVLL